MCPLALDDQRSVPSLVMAPVILDLKPVQDGIRSITLTLPKIIAGLHEAHTLITISRTDYSV